MAKNYTDEQTQHMISVYQTNPTRETVDKLANEMGKTVKSVIGKLSREKVYVKKDYTTKRGEKPITKLEMVQEIADMLQGDKERLQTLEKSSKAELLYLKVLVEVSPIVLLAFMLPNMLSTPNKLWFKFGILLSSIIAPIVMALVYFLTVLPTGLIMLSLIHI